MRALFGFHGELRDFFRICPDNDVIEIERLFAEDSSTVKDSIEALGVPHTEVAFILVDNCSVDFSFIVRHKNIVDVYPISITPNIKSLINLQPIFEGEPRFVLDVHLGRLAKYLRILGIDSFYEKYIDDKKLADISVDEKRILITRDRGLLKRKKIEYGYWIRSTNYKEQLIEIEKRYVISDYIVPLSRCLCCNHCLESVEKIEIQSQLQAKTYRYFDEFYRCPSCMKIYWKGSHFDRMMEFVENLF